MQVRDLAAHAKWTGVLETDAAQRALRNIRYLTNLRTPFDHVEFSVDFKATGPKLKPDVQGLKFSDEHVPVAQIAECEATMAAWLS